METVIIIAVLAIVVPAAIAAFLFWEIMKKNV